MVAVVSPTRAPRTLIPILAPPSLAPDPAAQAVLIAVPAFNEERFIGSVVHEIKLLGFECLVIDDGSSDRTPEIASAAGAIVERHALNCGKAAALNTAFDVARRSGTAILVIMDGDWQHDPREIQDLIEPIRTGKADMVSGSRFLPTARGHVPGVRAVGMRALTISSSLVSGQSMTDALCGFRAFSRFAIEAFRFKSDRFSVEFEMQFMARHYGMRQVEVPITARYDDPPKRNVIWYGVRALGGLIRVAAGFRPLLLVGVPSAIILVVGALMGLAVVDTYERSSEFSASSALLTLLLVTLGSIGLLASVLAHVLRAALHDLEAQLQALWAASIAAGSRH